MFGWDDIKANKDIYKQQVRDFGDSLPDLLPNLKSTYEDDITGWFTSAQNSVGGWFRAVSGDYGGDKVRQGNASDKTPSDYVGDDDGAIWTQTTWLFDKVAAVIDDLIGVSPPLKDSARSPVRTRRLQGHRTDRYSGPGVGPDRGRRQHRRAARPETRRYRMFVTGLAVPLIALGLKDTLPSDRASHYEKAFWLALVLGVSLKVTLAIVDLENPELDTSIPFSILFVGLGILQAVATAGYVIDATHEEDSDKKTKQLLGASMLGVGSLATVLRVLMQWRDPPAPTQLVIYAAGQGAATITNIALNTAICGVDPAPDT